MTPEQRDRIIDGMLAKGASRDDIKATLARIRAAEAGQVIEAPPEVSAVEAGARGVAQGALMGFPDEVAGLASKAAQTLLGEDHGVDPSFREDAYTRERNRYRAADVAGTKAHPMASIGGQVAGALGTAPLLPLKGIQGVKGAMQAAAVGAGAGALSGAGGASELSDVPADAALGGVVGGAIGGASPYVARAIGAIRSPSAIKQAIANAATEAGKQADELRVLTASGAHGGSISDPAFVKAVAKRMPGAVSPDRYTQEQIAYAANKMREQGMAPILASTQKINDLATAAASRAQARITPVLNETKTPVSLVELADEMAKRASVIGSNPAKAPTEQQLLALREQVLGSIRPNPETFGPPSPMRSLREMQGIVQGYGSAAKFGEQVPEGATKARAETTRIIRQLMDEAVSKESGPLSLAQYKENRGTWNVADMIADLSQRSLNRAGKNSSIPSGLEAVAMAAAPKATIPAFISQRVIKPYQATARASFAEAARALGNKLGGQAPQQTARDTAVSVLRDAWATATPQEQQILAAQARAAGINIGEIAGPPQSLERAMISLARPGTNENTR